MSEPFFFPVPEPLPLGDLAESVGVRVSEADAARLIQGVASLEEAGPTDLTFMDGVRHVEELKATRAAACLVAPRFAEHVPATTVALRLDKPYPAFVALARRLHAAALRPGSAFGATGIAAGAVVHPQARLEPDVTVDPGAVIGPGAEIGSGTVIAAGAVVGPGVRIGRNCAIGAGATLQHALLGDRVIVHPGARIGQDGFGYLPGARHAKVPQLRRVILQDDVEIGAGTTIDRGGLRDTVIGEGSKIDNLVQIAHNVVIGRHCIVVSQTGIAGSATLGDYVMLGGQVGVIGHIRIGDGARIAASSNVKDDVPPGVEWGGSPAKPMREWFREVMAVQRLARAERPSGGRQEGQ